MRKESNLSLEKGAFHKDWGGRFPIALGYPNHYALAMSNLGFQTIYYLLNQDPRIVAERFYLDDAGRLNKVFPLLTQESCRPVTDARIIIFSVSFERDYVNLVTQLKQAGLPALAKDRDENHPLVLAGGVTTFINPLPLFPFVDGFLLGEGETQIPVFAETLLAAQDLDRSSLLSRLTRVPGFIRSEFPGAGGVALPRALSAELVPRTFVAAHGDGIFSDTLLLEVNRGCPRGCRFCAAGFVYRPFRNHPLEALKKSIKEGLAEFGFKRVGLVGSALGDHPELKKLCRWLIAEGLSFSFSSIRIDAIDDQLLALMLAGGVKSITIAPEAGSESLRRALRKNLTRELILAQAARVAQAGIGRLKLYFLMGLPGEKESDLTAIVELVKDIRQVMLDKRKLKQLNIALSVSLNPFVPKPQTPMQWAPFAPVKELKRKQKFLLKELNRIGGINVEMESPVNAAWQALLSRGGPELTSYLLELAAQPDDCGRRIKELVAENRAGLEALDFASAAALPWDFLEHSTDSAYLKKEFGKYMSGLGNET